MKHKKTWKLSAYFTVEASYVLPLAMGVFFFCVGVLLYVSDRCIWYENMMRRAVVIQMEMDTARNHEIVLMPTLNTAKLNATWSRQGDELILISKGVEKSNYTANRLLGAKGHPGTDYEMRMSVFDPVREVRSRRRMKLMMEKGLEGMEK